jgi:hypothetical protein
MLRERLEKIIIYRDQAPKSSKISHISFLRNAAQNKAALAGHQAFPSVNMTFMIDEPLTPPIS